MSVDVLKRHWFPLALAGGMILFELAVIALLVFGQPAGFRWLGGTLQSPDDAAFYLAEIREGELLIRNPHAVEPHARRFDLVWSTLALTHRLTGASPVLLQELARIAFTILLAFAIYGAAQSVAANEADARLGALLATGGIGLGWLHTVLLGLMGVVGPAAPDVGREFAVGPTLLGGAHLILSTALLLIAVRGVWRDVHDRMRVSWQTIVASVLLTTFHPYFLPLIAAIIFVAWMKQLARRPARREAHRPALILGLCLVPAALAYGWLFRDEVFAAKSLQNVVTFGSASGWLFALLPAFIALGWIVSTQDRDEKPFNASRWCIVWLGTAFVLMLALPVPWRGKLLEGLMIPIALLTLPAWTALFKKIPKPASIAVLAFVVAATPLLFFASHMKWLADPVRVATLGQPSAVFRAWQFLDTQPGAVVLADNRKLDMWSPARARVTAWLGHPAETPGYAGKLAARDRLFTTDNVDEARAILDTMPITHLLLSSPASAERMRLILSDSWESVFEDGDIRLLQRDR